MKRTPSSLKCPPPSLKLAGINYTSLAYGLSLPLSGMAAGMCVRLQIGIPYFFTILFLQKQNTEAATCTAEPTA